MKENVILILIPMLTCDKADFLSEERKKKNAC